MTRAKRDRLLTALIAKLHRERAMAPPGSDCMAANDGDGF